MIDCNKIAAVKSDYQEKYQTPSVHLPTCSKYLPFDRRCVMQHASERELLRTASVYPDLGLRILHQATILTAAALPPIHFPFLHGVRGRGLLRKRLNLQVEMALRFCKDECVQIVLGAAATAYLGARWRRRRRSGRDLGMRGVTADAWRDTEPGLEIDRVVRPAKFGAAQVRGRMGSETKNDDEALAENGGSLVF